MSSPSPRTGLTRNGTAVNEVWLPDREPNGLADRESGRTARRSAMENRIGGKVPTPDYAVVRPMRRVFALIN